MSEKQKIRLIVSFIGNTDLKYLNSNLERKEYKPESENKKELKDKSPILRLLDDYKGGLCSASWTTELLLLDDDPEGKNQRKDFCEALEKELITTTTKPCVKIIREPIQLPKGPTDLNALYEKVWAKIPLSGYDEYVFHLSSGSSAMYAILLIAADSLRLKKVHLFETSREQGLQKIELPFILAQRKRQESRRKEKEYKLTEKEEKKQAKKMFLPDTVIKDRQVKAEYAILFKAACRTKGTPRHILVKGPVGSGKWHACRQFATWREGKFNEWLEPPQEFVNLPECQTLLIRHIEKWSPHALQQLASFLATQPDLTIAATYVTDNIRAMPVESLEVNLGVTFSEIELPSLGMRDDVFPLAESLARQLGIADGKIKERFQSYLINHPLSRNLHELKKILTTTDAFSSGIHPEPKILIQVEHIQYTEFLIKEACKIIMGMDFGAHRYQLDNVLEVIRSAIVRLLVSADRSQEEAGKLLGISQQTVSEILRKKIDLSLWQTPQKFDNL